MADILSDMMPPGANMGGDDEPPKEDEEKKQRGDNLAERYAKKKIRSAATRTASRAGSRLASRLATQAAMSAVRGAATAVASSPVGWIIAGVIIAIIILMIFFFNITGSGTPDEEEVVTPPPGQTALPIPGLTLSLTGPESIENGTLIQYTINYSHSDSGAVPLESITIYNDIPNNVSFESATGDYSESGNTISWPLEGLSNSGSFQIVFRPSGDDILVINKAYARTTASAVGGGATGGKNIPPTADNCNGMYLLNNPIGNFGDPKCNFTKDQLYIQLQSLDPTNANLWFHKIIPCESSYNPNTWADPIIVGTPDPVGAWGLFQMGRGRNGQYDHGDVAWGLQIRNAINYYYNVMVPAGIIDHGAYWQCAQGGH